MREIYRDFQPKIVFCRLVLSIIVFEALIWQQYEHTRIQRLSSAYDTLKRQQSHKRR